MKLNKSAENYLENIYILQQTMEEVRSIDLANEMNFSKPSVSRAIHLLEDKGMVTIADNGALILTEQGFEIASKIHERHSFLAGYFMALGVPEEVAIADACSIEHGLSDITYKRLRTHIKHCACDCPHAPAQHFFEFNSDLLRTSEKKRKSS